MGALETAIAPLFGRVHVFPMKWKLTALLICATSLAGAVLYAPGASVSHEVAGHIFVIPEERLFDARIPWLPPSKTSSFTFILDFAQYPQLIPPHRVLVQAPNDVCGDGQAQMLRIACGRETAHQPLEAPFTKTFPIADYPYAWDYYATIPSSAEGEQPQRLQVADCSPISPNPARPKGTAICTTVWNVDGLILSLGFEEYELPDIAAMRERASKLLLSWETH